MGGLRTVNLNSSLLPPKSMGWGWNARTSSPGRTSTYGRLSSNPGHSARCERGQHVYQQSPFDDLDPLVQGGFVVAVEHRDGLLGQNRPGVGPRIDQVHGAAGDLDAVVQCLRYGMRTGKRRQQRRMGIETRPRNRERNCGPRIFMKPADTTSRARAPRWRR